MKIYNILLHFIVALFLISCTQSDDDTWLVGTSADNPPYEYIQDGKIVGFDIDVMQEIGDHLGKKIQFKNMDFHGLLAAISTGNIDMAIAGMSVTQKRESRVLFSTAYTNATVTLLYRTKDGLKFLTDLRGKKVGAQLGTIWTLIAHDISLKHHFKLKSLSNNLLLVEELKNQRIDAIILEEAQAMNLIKRYPIFSSFTIPKYNSSFAIAMPKDSTNKSNINRTIEFLKTNNIIEKLSKKWGIIGAE